MPLDFALTDEGLNTPRLQEARAQVVLLWRARFGENAYTASDSPDGLIIDSLAVLLDLLWVANGQLWADSFFRTANANALDLLLDLMGKRRLDAAASTALAVWYGTDSTAIPVDSVVSVNDTEDRFDTDAADVIGDTNTVFVGRVESTTDDTYTLTINGTGFDFVAVGKTIVEIRDGLISDINGGGEPVTATSGGVDAAGFGLVVVDADDGETAMTFVASVAGAGVLNDFDAARVAMTATVTGGISALAGSLQTVESVISGVEGVTTTLDATVGRDRETDEAFRVRHLQTLQSGGTATDKALRARILLDVADVVQVRVFSNRDDVVDSSGRPPHSVEAVVRGGLDADIAQVVFENTPSGIAWTGSTTIVVTDEEGGTHSVKFSRPTERFLHLEITITQGEGYPTTGSPGASIITAVAAFLAPGGGGDLNMGTDLSRFQLGEPINQAVDGILNAVILTDDTPAAIDVPVFTAADIVVLDDEILISDSTRITVIGA